MPPPPGRGSARHRRRCARAPASPAPISASVSITAPPWSRAARRGLRAAGSAGRSPYPRRWSAGPRWHRRIAAGRKAAAIGAQFAGWAAKMRGMALDLAGAQQFRKADLAAQHVRPGAAGHDDVVRRPEAEILPQLIGQRLGALEEERVPVVAGVEDTRRSRDGGVGGILPTAGDQFDARRRAPASAPSLPGWCEAGAMIVARIPPAAA